MSSLNVNPNMTPSEILQLNLNDSALELLNAAIVSHQVKIDGSEHVNEEPALITARNEPPKNSSFEKTNTNAFSKRELDKDEQTVTAPKRVGRKPLDKSQIPDASLDPKQKRKAQNRAAQRAFRDRKEKHLAELQARIEELEALNSTKNEDLIRENQTLKEQLQKLQEENYALRGAQFTFEFPISDSINKVTPQSTVTAPITTNAASTTTPTTATPVSVSTNNNSINMNYDNMNNFYQMSTSGSSTSSGNSYSGEDNSSSAEQHSPLSNNQTHEDDSTSADTPVTSNNLFSADPIQFGLIQQPDASNNLDFLAVADITGGIGDGYTTVDNFPTGDLFHSKDDIFSNYAVPANNTNEDFLFTNEDLSALFGGSDDVFNFNNIDSNNIVPLSLNAQFGLPETPTTRRLNITPEKKQMLIRKLKQAQQEGKYVYQIHQELEQTCPDFDINALCEDLKKKAQCSMSPFPITDHEIDAFIKCLSH
ncbi:MAG: hypothetical protein EXX96DRAFT_582213 [Benjaminiella poitrasii]|nr:MAG: hypothetical protein EXX96DRAFT_582213 [Benjaminiella poitrasii]